MPTIAQIEKLYGNLPDVGLQEVDKLTMRAVMATPQLEGGKRCGHPDALDDEIANADPFDLSGMLDIPVDVCRGAIDAHQRMRAAATGKGSYPPGCNPLYPEMHAVSVLDDPATWPSHLQRTLTDAEFQSIIDAKVWGPSGDWKQRPFTMKELKDTWGTKPLNEVVRDFSEETYRRCGVILYPVFTGESGQHNIHVSYPVIAGGTIGIGWFPDSTPCPGDHVNLHIDKTYTSGFQGQFGLKIHELGHTLQGPHQFSNQGSHQEPMSYSFGQHLVVGYSTGDPQFGLPRAPSMSLWERLYGGKPVGVPWKGKFEPGTPPPPPGDTERVDWLLRIQTEQGGRIIVTNDDLKVRGQRVIVVPRPI